MDGESWGKAVVLRRFAPSARRRSARPQWWARFQRRREPGGGVALMRMIYEIDVRHVLPAVRVPTLVLHRSGDRLVAGRAAALPGRAHPGRAVRRAARRRPLLSFAGDADADPRRDRGVPHRRAPRRAEPDRVLATVLFTDIVGSTERGRRARRPALARAPRGAPRASSARSSSASAAARSIPRATASSPPSTARRARSAAPWRSATASGRSASRCAPACTPASAR